MKCASAVFSRLESCANLVPDYMDPLAPPRSRIWRFLRYLLIAIVLLLCALVARCFYAFRDRHPNYSVAINIDPRPAASQPRPLSVGFGRKKINPDMSDPGRPVWVAGFGEGRRATKIHDDLWCVATVLDDGYHRVGIVALDAIGFFHDDVIEVRRAVPAEWKIDYTIVCSTHNHSTPDLLGLWGPDFLHTGVDPQYRQEVIDAAVSSLGEAVKALQPTRVAAVEIPTKPDGLETDTRKPEVYDPDIRVLQFRHPSTGATIGTLVGWADHPETPWGDNTEITADFPGYLRDALEKGVEENGKIVEPGLGGIHVYINGAIGGLMTTSPKVTVHDPYNNQDYKPPTHEKGRALGRQLLSRILPRLRDASLPTADTLPIGIQAQTISAPLDNVGFLLAPVIGLMDRGHERWKVMRTEVGLVTLGDISFACIPGEIYPEIVNGGIETPPGADYPIAPVEVPPIRELMPGKIKFIFGLANDEIGYLIPKSEWDRQPPYLYNSTGHLYGEVNSVGPDAAGAVHQGIKELCQRAKSLVSANR
jgi:hypothetical protein